MKEYTAIHYVKDHTGCLRTPGEIFEAEYSAEDEERLIRIGAVSVCDSCNAAAEEIEAEAFEEDTENDAEDAEIEDDAPPIVIDVMEGISAPKKGRRK